MNAVGITAEQILELKSIGLKQCQVAERLGVSQPQISKLCTAFGIKWTNNKKRAVFLRYRR